MASAHFMVDGYGNIYAPLLPLLIPKLHSQPRRRRHADDAVSDGGVGGAGRVRPPRGPLAAAAARDGRAGRVGAGAQPRRPGAVGAGWLAAHPDRRRSRRRGVSSAGGGAGAPARRQRVPASRCRCTSPAARSAFRSARCCSRRWRSTSASQWTPLLAIPGLLVVAFFLTRVPPIALHHARRGGFRRAAAVRATARPPLRHRRAADADVAGVRDVRAGDADAARPERRRGGRDRRGRTCSPAASAGSSAARRRIGSARGG